MLDIVLASSSVYRRELLARLEVPFSYTAPNIDESCKQNESAIDLVLRLAEAKARAVVETHPKSLIIAADQVSLCNDKILTKPHSHENAKKQLRSLSNQSAVFITGLCLLNTVSGTLQKESVCYTVFFRNLSDEEIERYLLQEKPYDCAGSFKSEGYGVCLIDRMEGEDPSSLVGLPLIFLAKMLRNEGLLMP